MLEKLAKHARIAAENWRYHRIGRCIICGFRGPFYSFDGEFPDEMLLCLKCRSVSRQRLLTQHLLVQLGIDSGIPAANASSQLAQLNMLDSSGNGPLSRVVAPSSNWIRGAYSKNRNSLPKEMTFVDLQSIPFSDNHFDVVITEDVLEHIPDPYKALDEISRVLKPNGFHIFTVPVFGNRSSSARAKMSGDEIEYLAAPEYHWDPSIREQCLVFTDFGTDFPHIINQTGLSLRILDNNELPARKLLGNRVVYLSRKSSEL